MLLACMDDLKGLRDDIKAVFPEVNIQRCIIHNIRNSIKYISSKDSREFMADLKEVYKAVNEEQELKALESLEETWEKKYSIVTQWWLNNWDNLFTYFDFPREIRRIIYTINAFEGFNR